MSATAEILTGIQWSLRIKLNSLKFLQLKPELGRWRPKFSLLLLRSLYYTKEESSLSIYASARRSEAHSLLRSNRIPIWKLKTKKLLWSTPRVIASTVEENFCLFPEKRKFIGHKFNLQMFRRRKTINWKIESQNSANLPSELRWRGKNTKRC